VAHGALQHAPAEERPGPEGEADREQDAERAPDRRDPLHAQQVTQRELDADGEHQEDHADLGEELEAMDVGDGRTWCERADQDSAEDVAEDQRLPGQSGQDTTEDGGHEDIRQVSIEDGVGDHGKSHDIMCMTYRSL
jgi:hypothetical protein